jgi:autotransporter family porin
MGRSSPISIVNSGDITATATGPAAISYGISAATHGANSPIDIENSGTIDPKVGILSFAYAANSPTTVTNTGTVESTYIGIFAAAGTAASGSPVSIVNSRTVTTTGGPGSSTFTKDGLTVLVYAGQSVAIFAASGAGDSPLLVDNSGTVEGLGSIGIGVVAVSVGANRPITVENSGSVYGTYIGIIASSYTGTKIVNSGDISAGSNLAISAYGAPIAIYNSGHITGFVVLTNSDDAFINQDHGVFETKLTSTFGGGNDLFRNEQGGTVLAATNRNASEYSSFVGLERFENTSTSRAGRSAAMPPI